MKRLKILVLLLCLFLGKAVHAQVNNPAYKLLLEGMYSKTVPLITVPEAAKVQARDKAVVFLDTRESEEYAVSHLKNAVWVGYNDFNLKRLAGIPKPTPLIVYCSVGYRSEKVGEKLLKAGYTNVHNLYGSIFEWVNQGYPVYKNKDQPTTAVHAYNRTWGIWLQQGKKVY